MKASSTDLYHFDQLARLVSERFCLLSGQDMLFVEQVLLGAKGGVLTSAALLPGYWGEVQKLAEEGRAKEALAMQGRLNPMMDALFAEQFPEAVRQAFSLIGLSISHSLPPVGALSAASMLCLEAAVDALVTSGVLAPL